MEDLILEIEKLSKEIDKIINNFKESDLKELARHIHSVKGGVATLGFKELSTLVHKIEKVLYYIIEKGLDSEIKDLFENSVKAVSYISRNLKADESRLIRKYEELTLEIDSFSKTRNIEDEKVILEKSDDMIVIPAEKNAMFKIDIIFDEDFDMKFLKAYLIEEKLKEFGNIIFSEIEQLQEDEKRTEYSLTFQTFNTVKKDSIIEVIKNIGDIKNVYVVLLENLIKYYKNKEIDDLKIEILYIGGSEKKVEFFQKKGYSIKKIEKDIIDKFEFDKELVFFIFELDNENELIEILEKIRKRKIFSGFILVNNRNNLILKSIAYYHNCAFVYEDDINILEFKIFFDYFIERSRRLRKI